MRALAIFILGLAAVLALAATLPVRSAPVASPPVEQQPRVITGARLVFPDCGESLCVITKNMRDVVEITFAEQQAEISRLRAELLEAGSKVKCGKVEVTS